MAKKRKNPFPWLFVGGGVLIILAAVSWAMLNKPPAPVATATPGSISQVQRVPLEDAKAAYDAKTAVFLDVRDSGSYATSHIPGAISIPLADLNARIGELDPKSWIITY